MQLIKNGWTFVILFIIIILFPIFSMAQKSLIYKYYFLEIRPTGRGEVEITPEMQVKYEDIDTLIVLKREMRKNGYENITGKKYSSYSSAFNILSNAGLEFVQFVYLPTYGGATGMLVSEMRINYIMWRKRID